MSSALYAERLRAAVEEYEALLAARLATQRAWMSVPGDDEREPTLRRAYFKAVSAAQQAAADLDIARGLAELAGVDQFTIVNILYPK